MKRDSNFLNLCNTLLNLATQVRDGYVRQTATTRERICGDWVCKNSRHTFHIFFKDDRYQIEMRSSNPLNRRMRISCFELKQDAEGNLYFGVLESAVAYDSIHDRLLTEDFGIFERQKI